jgi:arylsulfatase
VLRCKATDKDDPTVDLQFGRVGRQKIENTGALNTKRMETIDEEFLSAAKDFIQRQHEAGKPWFCYFNTTRMHVFTHLKKESRGKTGLGTYPDGMVETDGHVGELLKLLDDLKVADNTVVVYTTDNGAECVTWPDGGATPFKGEKDTNWEGGFRVPCVIRWPAVIKAGAVINDVCAHEDFIPTFAAAAGEPELGEKLRAGYTLNGKRFKVYLDGSNLLPFFKGEQKTSPREAFFYWSDDGDLMALRFREWKCAFLEQNNKISPEFPMGPWAGEFSKLRTPKLYNLRADPYERGPGSLYYSDWMVHRMFIFVPAQAIVMKYLETFKEFPPRAKPSTFTVSDAMEKITAASGIAK